MDKVDIYEFLKNKQPTKFTADSLALIFNVSVGHVRRKMSLISSDKKYWDIKTEDKIRKTSTGKRVVYMYYYSTEKDED